MSQTRNSIRQMLRMPVRTALFVLLLAVAVCLLALGVHLQLESQEQMRLIEESFTTIGTVRQLPNSMRTGFQWSALENEYQFTSGPVYDAKLPPTVLDFDDANYIEQPEQRPYYGAYHPDYVISDREYERSVSNERGHLIVEFTPLEDCVPSQPVKIKVKRLLLGTIYGDLTEIWFMAEYLENPPEMKAGKTYVSLLTTRGMTDKETGERTTVYLPGGFVESTQVDKNGKKIADNFSSENLWEEVTEGYYDSLQGRCWLNLIEGYEKFENTIPVTPTNSTKLLMAFHNGGATIGSGRDISEEEYRLGERVCLIPRYFAKNNSLNVGDTLELPLYFANYGNSPSQNYQPNGWGTPYASPLNAQGQVYPVFDDGSYTIVGIYDLNNFAYEVSGFDMGGNEVVIPAASVKNSDENNILRYAPMQAFNTSFQIPNGSIASYTEAWSKQGISNVEIQFYDRGYTQIKSGLDAMKNVSLVLVLSGAAATLLILTFFTYLFITTQKKRTAIERSLGMSKKSCLRSLLSGVILITLIGCLMGGVLGYATGGRVRELVIDAGQDQLFDTTFSSWVNNADVQLVLDTDMSNPDPLIFVLVALSTMLIAVLLALAGIRGNLRSEPLTLLSSRSQ
ncbi:MAG: ABC transporter permease [Oscillospiraceae bacterium]|jgi:hypothetical protein|nr:ABC transporter permease [Oscillospiraceae bacterium]